MASDQNRSLSDLSGMAGVRKTRVSDAPTEVGLRLRAARIVLELRQEDLAQVAGNTPHAISQWEKGNRLAGVLELGRIADRYGLTLDWLYLGRLAGVRSDLALRLSDALAALESNLEAPHSPTRPAKPFRVRPEAPFKHRRLTQGRG